MYSGTCMGTGLTGMAFHGATGYMATGDGPYVAGDGMKPTGGGTNGMPPGGYTGAMTGTGGGGGGFGLLAFFSESDSESEPPLPKASCASAGL